MRLNISIEGVDDMIQEVKELEVILNALSEKIESINKKTLNIKTERVEE